MIDNIKQAAVERIKRNSEIIRSLPISEQAKDLILTAVTMRGIQNVAALRDDLLLIGANRCEVIDFLLVTKICGFDTIADFAACADRVRRKRALNVILNKGGVKRNRVVIDDILSGNKPMLFDEEELFNG